MPWRRLEREPSAALRRQRESAFASQLAIVDRDTELPSEASGHRSATGTVGTTGHAADSALRECDESRGTRCSERHSAQNDAGGVVHAAVMRCWVFNQAVQAVAQMTGPGSTVTELLYPTGRRSRTTFTAHRHLKCAVPLAEQL